MATKKSTTKKAKMGYMEFVERAITRLRNGKSKGIHTVYSGFNSAFREYYGDDVNPIEVTKKLEEQGKIVIRPCKGGVMLYLAGDAPQARSNALTKILED
mgnify:CR=1 FL=1